MSARGESVIEQIDKESTAKSPDLFIRDHSLQKYVYKNIVKILKTIFADNNPDSLIELVPGLVGIVTIKNFEGMDRDAFKDYIINNEIDPDNISTSRQEQYSAKRILLPRSGTWESFFKARESCEQMKITLKFKVDVPNPIGSSSKYTMCLFDMYFEALRLTQERIANLLIDNPRILVFDQEVEQNICSIQ
ncbi:hypothetical protein [Legionella worsleiensis]|uniref:Uncharacterized protein n=1 Tax=Legionella worsleiensis TaxID=45076 RepID=A0A0W1AH67_9GAMM|nr:hypothetical protein [Legionella worsleiensis]KTD80674.1 hypothetical protein Lwor_0917 [Legionella worsleiensis]STY32748.1 Uncharacterised protein [Legionella worsleiensis]